MYVFTIQYYVLLHIMPPITQECSYTWFSHVSYLKLALRGSQYKSQIIFVTRSHCRLQKCLILNIQYYFLYSDISHCMHTSVILYESYKSVYVGPAIGLQMASLLME